MQAILVVVATLGTIVFNTLAANGYVNDVSPKVISEKYPTLLTPAGYAFSIWSLIYLGLTAFSIYQLRRTISDGVRRIRSLYILSCVFNCAWIYFWHHEQIGASLAVILMLLGTLLLIEIKVRDHRTVAETWLVRSTFGLYLGWVTVASMVNLLVFVSYLGVELPITTAQALASVMIIAAAAIAVAARVLLKNFFFPLAVAWALTAIAIEHSGMTSIVLSAAIGVVICLVATGSFVVTLKDSTSE